ncbi:hypothetical protein [Nocardia sp. NPDC058705]|uniref:hypothetical protein n=1 Tax=Nocardia sp. NPDC058705 TaxID=3346609 RepID=UPI00369EDD48
MTAEAALLLRSLELATTPVQDRRPSTWPIEQINEDSPDQGFVADRSYPPERSSALVVRDGRVPASIAQCQRSAKGHAVPCMKGLGSSVLKGIVMLNVDPDELRSLTSSMEVSRRSAGRTRAPDCRERFGAALPGADLADICASSGEVTETAFRRMGSRCRRISQIARGNADTFEFSKRITALGGA